MPLSEAMLKQLMTTFQKELEEHVDALNKGFLALETNLAPDERDNLLKDIFRAAHSMKGAARTVNLGDIESIAHRMESILESIRKEYSPLPALHIDAFLKALDTISMAMTAHTQGECLPAIDVDTALSGLDAVMRDREGRGQPQAGIPPGTAEASRHRPSNDASPPEEIGASTCESPHDIQLSVSGSASLASQNIGTPMQNADSRHTTVLRPSAGDDTIRVATTKMDALMGSLSELMVVSMRTEQFLDQMKTMEQRTIRWRKKWRKARPYSDRLRRDRVLQNQEGEIIRLLAFLDENEQELKTISAVLSTLIGNLKNDRNYLQFVVDELQNGIRNARMLPVAALFDIFPRMARDLARDSGKDIVLEMAGQETEVDRQALELMKDPLTHILRNAIDHGIESPEARLSCGKSRYGTIQISAEQRGGNIVLTVSDDGRGINLEAIRRSAVEHGLLSQEKAAGLSVHETIELIFLPGLSTAKQITGISGRGVGMDVVRNNLEKIHGMIRAETVEGLGTTFILVLPLTLATSHILLVRVAGETLALPMMNVERMLRVSVGQIKSIEGHPAVNAEGRPLPLVSLAHVLGLPEAKEALPPDAKIPVVIVSVVEKRIALRVDGFLSSQQIVIKSLGSQLRKVRNISGVTILGDGQLVVVLNMADIMKSIQTRSVPSAALPVIKEKYRRRRVMVVDDSITTRTLEKHILENAGYDVLALVDGMEAWELIYGENTLPDLIVSDIDMPRMNGFDLARAIKGDGRYVHIPVVLVTSLDSQQDRLKGMESGADAYIVKSAFDQRELLEAIERLIE